MADFREYQGIDFSSMFLVHYGVGHENGGHSGRYAWGSGEKPMQDSPLDKGSPSKPYRYVHSKSIENQARYYAKKLAEGKITIETIHYAKAAVSESNPYASYLTGKEKAKLNRDEKDAKVMTIKADNHEGRPHARTKKIAEGTAEVKLQQAGASNQYLPSLYGTTAYQNYVPDPSSWWLQDVDLPTLPGTPHNVQQPDSYPMAANSQQEADSYFEPINDSLGSHLRQEKKRRDEIEKKLNSPVTKLVLGMAKVADKVVNALKRLKNVVVSWFKHSDEGFYLVHKHDNTDVYKAVDYTSCYIKHREKKHYRTYYRGISKWQTLESI